MKVEYAFAVDKDGNQIGKEIRGGKGSIRTPFSYHRDGGTFSHIHPRDAGMLGGTFSSADIQNFINGESTLRAVAKEGTYSISKGKNFDAAGMRSYNRKIERDFNTNYKELMKSANDSYVSGKIGYNEYNLQAAKAFNTSLISLHNAFIAGQKTYGYNYTLEKRG